MEKHNKEIEKFTNELAKELIEMPSFDIERIKLVLKTRVSILLTELEKINLIPLYQKKNDLLKEVGLQSLPGWRKRDIQNEITDLNIRIKNANKNISNISHHNEYELLKRMLKESHPEFLQNYIIEQQKMK